jgi:hypothetical protein
MGMITKSSGQDIRAMKMVPEVSTENQVKLAEEVWKNSQRKNSPP